MKVRKRKRTRRANKATIVLKPAAGVDSLSYYRKVGDSQGGEGESPNIRFIWFIMHDISL